MLGLLLFVGFIAIINGNYLNCILLDPTFKNVTFDTENVLYSTFTNFSNPIHANNSNWDWTNSSHLLIGEEIAPFCFDVNDLEEESPTCMSQCHPYGSTDCFGDDNYVTYYGNASSSSCFCYFYISGNFTNIYLDEGDGTDCQNVGQEQTADGCSLTCRSNTMQFIGYANQTCSELDHIYDQYACEYFKGDLTDTNLLQTYTYNMWHNFVESVTLNRVFGYVHIVFKSFSTKWDTQVFEYTLDFHDGKKYTGRKVLSTTDFIVAIQEQEYFSLANLTLTLKTSETWVLGSYDFYTWTAEWSPDIDGASKYFNSYVDIDYQNHVLGILTPILVGYSILIISIVMANKRFNLLRFIMICMFFVCVVTPAEGSLGCSSPSVGGVKVETIIDGEKVFRINGQRRLTNINGDSCFNLFDDEGTDLLQIKLTLLSAKILYPLQFYYSTFSWDRSTEKVRRDCGHFRTPARCNTDNQDLSKNECVNYYNCNDHLQRDFESTSKQIVLVNGIPTTRDVPKYGGWQNFFTPQTTAFIQDFSCEEGTRDEIDCAGKDFAGTKWSVMSKMYKRVQLPAANLFKVYQVQENNMQKWVTLRIQIDFLNGTITDHTVDLNVGSPSDIVPFAVVQNLELYNLGATFGNDNLNDDQSNIVHHTAKNGNVEGTEKNFWFSKVNTHNVFTIGNVGSIQCFANFTECKMNKEYCVNPRANQHSCNGGISEMKQFLDRLMDERIGVEKFASGDEYSVLLDNSQVFPSMLVRDMSSITGFDMKFSGLAQVGDILLSTTPVCKLTKHPVGCQSCSGGFSFEVEIFSSTNPGNVQVSSDSTNAGSNVAARVLFITTEKKKFILRGFTGNKQNTFNVIFASSTAACTIALNFTVFPLDVLKSISFSEEVGTEIRIGGGSNFFGSLGDFFNNLFGGIGDVFGGIFDFFGSISDFLFGLFGLDIPFELVLVVLILLCCCIPMAPTIMSGCATCCARAILPGAHFNPKYTRVYNPKNIP